MGIEVEPWQPSVEHVERYPLGLGARCHNGRCHSGCSEWTVAERLLLWPREVSQGTNALAPRRCWKVEAHHGHEVLAEEVGVEVQSCEVGWTPQVGWMIIEQSLNIIEPI